MAQISATKCELCSENDGSIFCYECKQAMCISCRSFHSSTRKHKVSDLNKVDRLVFQSELKCSTHQELYTFFCNHCKCLICNTCLLAEHKGHKFSVKEEIFLSARQNSIHLVSKGKEKLEEIKDAIDNVNSGHREKIEQDSDKVELQIKSTAEALHGIIDIVKDIRVNGVTDYKQLENEQIDKTVRKLEKLKVDYENTTSTFDQMLTGTHDTIFYQSYGTHKSTFDKLDDIPKYSKPDDIRTFDEEAFFVDILVKMTERFKSAKMAVEIVAKKDNKIKDVTQVSAESVPIFEPPVQDEIVITVKTLTGMRYAVNVKLTDTISDVKEKVHEESGMPSEQQMLFFRNKVLRNHLTVFDYNIQMESTINVSMHLRDATETSKN
ncbi:tripartite motif-containing protein 45-like [Mytilus californianus]|uniref:tripartite motif-containing protein 45-like n=1 Tax=Mytilus californianus TaxID=6549 RepID=UPI0022459CF5|nr:tripartite motif-containing protein 45-like [Mytilus californianus]